MGKKLEYQSPLVTCKECGEQVISIVKMAEISIRCAGTAIEIVADDICLNCLINALKQG